MISCIIYKIYFITKKYFWPLLKPVEPSKVAPEIKSIFDGVVHTSDKLGAGTDARVEIWLTGTNGKTVGPISVQEQESFF